jgi:hypothetical protein
MPFWGMGGTHARLKKEKKIALQGYGHFASAFASSSPATSSDRVL